MLVNDFQQSTCGHKHTQKKTPQTNIQSLCTLLMNEGEQGVQRTAHPSTGNNKRFSVSHTHVNERAPARQKRWSLEDFHSFAYDTQNRACNEGSTHSSDERKTYKLERVPRFDSILGQKATAFKSFLCLCAPQMVCDEEKSHSAEVQPPAGPMKRRTEI